jgi:hypothetical protein
MEMMMLANQKTLTYTLPELFCIAKDFFTLTMYMTL